MEFNPIQTQEEFNARIKDRLERERETVKKDFADYDAIKKRNAELEKELSGMRSNLESFAEKSKSREDLVAELTEKVKNYETREMKRRVAYEAGIPVEFSDRLTGENEDALREDAEAVAELLNSLRKTQPLMKDTEPEVNNEDSAYRALLQGLEGE